MKHILWINDEYSEEIDRQIEERWSDDDYKLTISENLTFMEHIDFVIFDYGMFGDDGNHKEILKKYYDKGVKIVWSGGFGGSGKYEKDCKSMFPEDKWMHTIQEMDLDILEDMVKQYLDLTEEENED